MSTYLSILVLGLGSAAVYIGLALGLLTIYRASGVINFAQAAVAMWGVFIYATLRNTGELVLPIGRIQMGEPDQLDWRIALIVSILACAVLGVLVQMIVFRPLRHSPTLVQVVASIAVMLAFQSLAEIRFGSNPVQVPQTLPATSLMVGAAALNKGCLVAVAIACGVAAVVWAYFRFTTAGLATYAMSMNERGAALLGYSPSRLSTLAWAISMTVSGSMLIFASFAIGMNPVNVPLLVVPALSILLLARFSSILVIVVGSIVLGCFQALITYESSQTYWPTWAQTGLVDAVPFLIILGVLLIGRQGLPARGGIETSSLPDVRIPRLRLRMAVVPALGLVVLFLTSGSDRFGVITSIAMSLLALSYVLITGYLGQVSLVQVSLAGAAGFILSKFTTNLGFPFVLALVASALFAGVLGMVVALPAFRIRGVQLVIVTLAAAVVMQDFIFGNPSFTPLAGLQVAPPTFFGADISVQSGRQLARIPFAVVVLAVVTVFFVLFSVLARGRLGRGWLAVRSNERAAAAAGVNVRVMKLIGFGASAVLAGVAGVLLTYSQSQFTAGSFLVVNGLLLLATAYLGGITSTMGAVIAGVLAPGGVVYVILNTHLNFGLYYNLVAAIGLILTAILNPVGIAGQTRIQYEWARKRLKKQAHNADLAPVDNDEEAANA